METPKKKFENTENESLGDQASDKPLASRRLDDDDDEFDGTLDDLGGFDDLASLDDDDDDF